MAKTLSQWRRHNRRSAKKLKHPLVPKEWYEYCSDINSYYSTRLKAEFTQEVRQAYFNSCFGNIYVKQDYYRTTTTNQCVLMSALVGSGNYTSFQFLDLVTHKKFDESFDHSVEPGMFNNSRWLLVSEMKVE